MSTQELKDRWKAIQKKVGAVADGDPNGLDTVTHLEAALGIAKQPPAASSFAALLVQIARTQIGVQESPRGSNRGPQVDEYQKATWLEKKDWGAWCAAFLCWVIREALAKMPRAFGRPETAGAWDFERWARTQAGRGVVLIKPAGEPVRAGDIVVFTFSHIGLASADETPKGVQTIEGNTNDEGSREGYEVAARLRKKSEIRAIIRFA